VLLGLVLGIGGAVLREYWDKRIRDGEEAAVIVGAPIIGSIPDDPTAAKRQLIVVADPHSIAAESYRRLRTNLDFLSHGRTNRSFLVCSALPSEGKTVLAANLSLALAQAGYRVVLVDADLRRPRAAKLFGIPTTRGLTDALADPLLVEDLIRPYDNLPLEILPSGPLPSNPSEMLTGFGPILSALTNRSDVVIVDSPALLPVTDASILARMTSGVILVARFGSTRSNQLEAATRSLRLVGAEVIGVVVNCIPHAAAYGRRYGRYAYAPPVPTENDRLGPDIPPHVPTAGAG
jgi:non-specific protein-tyrosine kinase